MAKPSRHIKAVFSDGSFITRKTTLDRLAWGWKVTGAYGYEGEPFKIKTITGFAASKEKAERAARTEARYMRHDVTTEVVPVIETK